STRTNLTIAFVAALAAVTTALGLTLWTVRNASLYRDVARYAATQADVAASLVRDAAATRAVIVGPDTASAQPQIVTPRLTAVLAVGITPQRIDKITPDVAAITDGRSLHRRLSMDKPGQEFERLIETLNAMISRLETSFGGLRRFTADASHELKTPLAVLRAD